MLGIFITAGHPDKERSIKALQVLDEAQVDLIEFGIPFSDPLMDGPTIQKSSFEALEAGVNMDQVFEIISEAKKRSGKTPEIDHAGARGKGLDNLILFSAFNPMFVYGFDKLIAKFKEHGIRGALIPDLPLDETKELSAKFSEHNMDLIILAAPSTTDERAKQICELSNPFIYLVSRMGTTGVSESFKGNETLKSQIADLKKHTDKPIGVGFGIDSPEKVKEVHKLGADMAIIGSKTVKVLAEDKTEELSEFKKFVTDCVNVIEDFCDSSVIQARKGEEAISLDDVKKTIL